MQLMSLAMKVNQSVLVDIVIERSRTDASEIIVLIV